MTESAADRGTPGGRSGKVAAGTADRFAVREASRSRGNSMDSEFLVFAGLPGIQRSRFA